MASSAGHELDLTLLAEADLSSYQYCAMKTGASAFGVAMAGANAQVYGILQNKPDASGKTAQVRTVRGTTSKLKIGGAVTVGLPLKSDAAGRGVDGSAALSKSFCVALEAGSAANEIIEVMLVDYYLAAS